MPNNTVLIIDDEPELRKLINKLLSLEGYNVLSAENTLRALEVINTNDIDIVVSDVKLPDGNGLDLIPVIKKQLPSAEIIILTAYGKIEDGVKAIKAGAFDYMVKGDEDNKLLFIIKNALEKIRLSKRITHYEKNFFSRYSFDDISGTSRTIKEAIDISRKAAKSTTPILLIGETGTGKEVFAQSVHVESDRKNEPFVAINCSAFVKDLLEAEMFGYKAGAFTGAAKNKKGLFEEADKGTLFLDEIGDMDPALQAKLLRVLENNTFIKQGNTKETLVDVRIIAATNKNLKALIEQEKFRKDLFYRISVMQINLPPLRDRTEDIPGMTDYFIKIFSTKLKKNVPQTDESFTKRLLNYKYPGNVRELKNIIERIILLNEKPVLTEKDLPMEFFEIDSVNININDRSLQKIEKNHIISILNLTKQDKVKTAEILGIGLTTLYRKLKEYGISGE